jgi:hypothetical protein
MRKLVTHSMFITYARHTLCSKCWRSWMQTNFRSGWMMGRSHARWPSPIRCPEPPPEAPSAHRPHESAAGRAGRVKGGAAGERSERTLDAPEHSGTLRRSVGRPSRPRRGPVTSAMAIIQPERNAIIQLDSQQVAAAEEGVATGGGVPRGGTYVLRDPTTGQVLRTGRIGDLVRRAAEHGRDPALRGLTFDPVYRTDVYAEQRGLEQLLHETHQPPLNRIRPISPGNPRFQEYLDAARRFLEDQ